MTRISFNEQGLPIPTEALPDGIDEDSDLAPITFQYITNDIFIPGDYTGFGYTHYEVACVGACGGRGGMSIHSFINDGGGYIFDGAWHDSALAVYGGGGGGGGLHVVTGELADLPEECEIVVGEPGASGADGLPTVGFAAMDQGEPGEDGGFSTFADDICMASGGKGGNGSNGAWQAYGYSTMRPGGNGGDGGIGGQTTAGGGGAGSEAIVVEEDILPEPFTQPVGVPWAIDNTPEIGGPGPIFEDRYETDDGADGTWDGEIGGGGGGGCGGIQIIWAYSEGPGGLG